MLNSRADQITSFEIDEDTAQLRFPERLAGKQGWNREYALRVVHEYKRFLVLASTGDEPATPSQAVDEAWHLHLTYTRNYWEVFCPQVLGKALHHDPSKGGEAEARKHAAQYRRTLDSYRVTFGQEPPQDIWPHPMMKSGLPRLASRSTLWFRDFAFLLLFSCGFFFIPYLVALSGVMPADRDFIFLIALFFWAVILVAIRHLLIRHNRRREEASPGAGSVWYGCGTGCGGGGSFGVDDGGGSSCGGGGDGGGSSCGGGGCGGGD